MSNARLETKVGAFVLVGLILLATLLVLFSKGVTRFARTYELRLLTEDVGSLKPGANVLMAGYTIGNVTDMVLTTNGETVELTLQIRRQYRIRTNATFVIEQSGFLGDEYVAVSPSTNRTARYLESGETVSCPPPFNLQAVARSAAGFIERIDDTARRLNSAIDDVRRLVLNEHTLTNLALTIGNLRTVSEEALVTVDDIHSLVETNRAPLTTTLSNLVLFSDQLRNASAGLDGIVATNAPTVTAAVKNIESSTVILESLLGDLQAGKGLAGALLRNEEMADNITAVSRNLSVTTSNLNRVGLWRVLWGPKSRASGPPPTNRTLAPKDPFH